MPLLVESVVMALPSDRLDKIVNYGSGVCGLWHRVVACDCSRRQEMEGLSQIIYDLSYPPSCHITYESSVD